MTDIYSREKHSQIMSKIRGRETKPEICVRTFLFRHGLRYRKNDKRFPGTPDIVLPKYRTIVFVHGCLWHGHEACTRVRLPRTNKKYWRGKVAINIARDEKNTLKLEEGGWKVYIVWECEIKNKKSRETRLLRLLRQIKT